MKSLQYNETAQKYRFYQDSAPDKKGQLSILLHKNIFCDPSLEQSR